jgi:hypothetical protein
MCIVKRADIAGPPRRGRHHDHGNRAPIHRLVPGNKQRSAAFINRRGQDLGNLRREPIVPIQNQVACRRAASRGRALHIVAQTRRDKHVPRHGVVGEIRRQLAVWPHVGLARGGIGHVGEVQEGIMCGRVIA